MTNIPLFVDEIPIFYGEHPTLNLRDGQEKSRQRQVSFLLSAQKRKMLPTLATYTSAP